jgi:DNA-binding MarR family transcriptional regulator
VLNHPFAGHAACRSREDAGLVERERDTTDRRSVTTKITSDGPRLLEALDEAAADTAPAGFSSIHSLNPLSRS